MAKKPNKWWRTKRSTTVKLNPDGESYCRYHDTDVVTWTKKYFILSMDGEPEWDSMTTRLRMNECSEAYGLRFMVFREKGVTYLTLRNEHVCTKGNVWSKENRKPFFDIEGTKIKIPSKRKPTCDDCTMKILGDVGGI